MASCTRALPTSSNRTVLPSFVFRANWVVLVATAQLGLLPDPAERSADDVAAVESVELPVEPVDEVEVVVAAEPEPAHAASIRTPEYVSVCTSCGRSDPALA